LRNAKEMLFAFRSTLETLKLLIANCFLNELLAEILAVLLLLTLMMMIECKLVILSNLQFLLSLRFIFIFYCLFEYEMCSFSYYILHKACQDFQEMLLVKYIKGNFYLTLMKMCDLFIHYFYVSPSIGEFIF
jgi:hypothetical protein